MKFLVRLHQLRVKARQSVEIVDFGDRLTFFHGPVSTGKSTIARLIDYCFGGELERTPAIRQEFVACELVATLGENQVLFERGSQDSSVRVTWSDGQNQPWSVTAPLAAAETPIWAEDVFNLSDLIFRLVGLVPMKVRRSKLDPESALVRLSFRELLWYCYLSQDHLDSSFYRLEEPFKRLKSLDVMRFVTGLHSERMAELDMELMRTLAEQRAKREAVTQLQEFIKRYSLGQETDLDAELALVRVELSAALERRRDLEADRKKATHALEPMRVELRNLTRTNDELARTISDIETRLRQREEIRSELLLGKMKAERVGVASRVLKEVTFFDCPCCGADLGARGANSENCYLCLSPAAAGRIQPAEIELLRRDINDRVDELTEAIDRQRRERIRLKRQAAAAEERKRILDQKFMEELGKYDSSYESSVREVDREIATRQERTSSLNRLKELPLAINQLRDTAARMQLDIDRLRDELKSEKDKLLDADSIVALIAQKFLEIIKRVGFPGVFAGDNVVLDPRNWQPYVLHREQSWTFYDAGSGGKKTLFNVCYSLALHAVAVERNLPLPSFLIIDSPTKNISEDENPALVKALYEEIYRMADAPDAYTQFILVDSAFVEYGEGREAFLHRRLSGDENEPRLISYYEGP